MAATIRLATGADAARCAAIYRPSVASAPVSFEVTPPDASEMRQRIDETLAFHPWLVCEHEGRVMGYAYAGRHRTRAAYRWSVDVSAYVDAAVHRCGIGRGLYTSLLRVVAAQGHVNAYAGITLPNPSSVGLHEAVGFRLVGIYRKVGYKFGAWHDVGWWELALQPHPAAPPEPVGVAAIERDPSWPSLVNAGLSCIRLDAPL